MLCTNALLASGTTGRDTYPKELHIPDHLGVATWPWPPDSGKLLTPVVKITFNLLDARVADHVGHVACFSADSSGGVKMLDNLGENLAELGVGIESLKKGWR